jgi:hypothetical protein
LWLIPNASVWQRRLSRQRQFNAIGYISTLHLPPQGNLAQIKGSPATVKVGKPERAQGIARCFAAMFRGKTRGEKRKICLSP